MYRLADSDLGTAATCGSDLLLRRGRERVCRHVQRDGDVAGAKDLDPRAAAYGSRCNEIGYADGGAALREQLPETIQVDDLVFLAERVFEATQLGQPHVQRHLTALEVLWNVVTGA